MFKEFLFKVNFKGLKNLKFKNKNKNNLIQSAKIAFNCGDFQRAEKLYEKIYCSHCFNSEELLNYGFILLKKEKLKKAEFIFLEVIKIYPNISLAYFSLGDIYFKKENLIESKKYFFKSLEIDPLFSEAYYKIALIYEEESQYQLALKNTNQALNIDPKKTIYNYRKAKILFQLTQNKEAKEILLNIISMSPKLSIAFSLLSIIYLREGNLNKAESTIKKAIFIDPYDHRYYLDLGNIYKFKKNLKAAELSTKKSIELNNNYPEAYSNLGNILKEQNKFKKAEYFLRKAILIKPDFALAYSNLGNLLKEQNKFKKAEYFLRKAILIKPNFALAYSNLGNVLKEQNKLKEAEIMLRKSILIDPYSEVTYSNLGIVLQAQGKLDSSKLCLEKALKINPNFDYGLLNLGTILRDLGNIEDAKKCTLLALTLNPDLVKGYFNLSLLGNYKDSYKNLFSKEITLKKSNNQLIDIYFARANFSHQLKDYKESLNNLLKANKYKLKEEPSQLKNILKKTKILFNDSKKISMENLKFKNDSEIEFIFIIGMPRSGSSLMESILSRNEKVIDLGETNFIEESYKEFKNQKNCINKKKFIELYFEKLELKKSKYKFVTDKMLSNYQYLGIISKLIPNAKFIQCLRNPLDNILSVYRSNFDKNLSFSSSITDSAKIYIDQYQAIKKYKEIYNLQIYSQSYENLVSEPEKEIKNLINWLDWEWDKKYLSPHLSGRSISTYSSVQVRKKINTNSIGSWRNYEELLKPAKKILMRSNSTYIKKAIDE